MKTWVKEAIVVGCLLAGIAYYQSETFGIEWLGSVAVFLTFCHTQIAFRMQEAEKNRGIAQVKCHLKAQYYFIAKEISWFSYFFFLKAWPALAGVVIFLLYPLWRKYHSNTTKENL